MGAKVLINPNDLSLEADGIISRNKVKTRIQKNQGQGIRFILASATTVEAHIKNLSSTQRNTVLAKNDEYVCLCEHFLAACALCNLTDIDLFISENELPFADGSAMCWLELFERAGLLSEVAETKFKIQERVLICDELDSSRFVELLPAESFSVTYNLDWKHPLINQQSYTWKLSDDINAIAKARTFSSESENQILGLSGWVIGLTEEGFTQELHFADEPARHKALDLVGDMMLSGVNPLTVGMQVISHKGGHELNSKVAKYLAEKYGS